MAIKKTKKPESDFAVLWKMTYACESFKNVRLICDYIVENKLDRQASLHHPLCVAIVAFYCRPFKKSNVVGSLPGEMIPKEHRLLHRQIELWRDQAAVHTDGDSVNHGRAGLPANNVRLVIENDGMESLCVSELKFSPEAISEIRQLAEIMIVKTTHHIERLGKKLWRERPTRPGEYLLDPINEKFQKI